ncbi:GNAT family N-acetyltransferase [Streptomyces boninensis]|uniref:GNAT family N-acetyltransferase n=1 Tax=Streptomyces boninensis TaxID=2039455 RepID=UPI003B214285
MRITPVPYDHPDAVKLDELTQLEYVERYGEGDATPMDPAHFEPPHGVYLLAYDEDDAPVATGGWRAMSATPEGLRDGDAEMKRMFVIREARGQGLARAMIAALEDSARAAGRLRMVLETGGEQPEAIALYRSSGYAPAERYGHYRNEPDAEYYAKDLRK